MILQVEDLTKTYSRQGADFDAVSHVSASLQEQELAILTGPSGCGKSTFFHLVAGMSKPTSGKVNFMGKQLENMPKRELAAVRATQLSYILQGESLLQNFSEMENICYPLALRGITEDLSANALELLECFGIKNMASEYPVNLSGGERKRVAIARAFVHRPKLVVADEPTSDLDEENTDIIMNFFREQSQKGTAILLSSHNPSCLKVAATHYAMSNGELKKIVE